MLSSLPPPDSSNTLAQMKLTSAKTSKSNQQRFICPQGTIIQSTYVSEPLIFYHKNFLRSLDIAFFFLDFATLFMTTYAPLIAPALFLMITQKNGLGSTITSLQPKRQIAHKITKNVNLSIRLVISRV